MSEIDRSTKLVLDSWPVMEWLKGREPARASFRSIIDAAFADRLALSMSRMNYGEVIYSIAKDIPGAVGEAARKAFLEIPIQFHSVDDALVDEAANLKGVYPISYADAFAAALSLRLDLPLVTGDQELKKLQVIGLKLLWVGP